MDVNASIHAFCSVDKPWVYLGIAVYLGVAFTEL